jgi:hypothetical protein
MREPRGVFFNVSGVDANEGAKIVFVWCRDKGRDVPLLLGSGHVVGAVDCWRPPGVASGQFRVTFPLPPGCSADSVVVTDDTNSEDYLENIFVCPCSSPQE